MPYDLWESCLLVPGFSRVECASWVQAWGSIAAVLGAFLGAVYVANRQIGSALDFEKERRRHSSFEKNELLRVLYSTLKGVLNSISDNAKTEAGASLLTNGPSVLAEMKRQFERLPVVELTNAHLMLHVTTTPIAIDHVLEALEALRPLQTLEPGFAASQWALDELIESVQGAHSIVDDALRLTEAERHRLAPP